jgi:hypothetical protein
VIQCDLQLVYIYKLLQYVFSTAGLVFAYSRQVPVLGKLPYHPRPSTSKLKTTKSACPYASAKVPMRLKTMHGVRSMKSLKEQIRSLYYEKWELLAFIYLPSSSGIIRFQKKRDSVLERKGRHNCLPQNRHLYASYSTLLSKQKVAATT